MADEPSTAEAPEQPASPTADDTSARDAVAEASSDTPSETAPSTDAPPAAAPPDPVASFRDHFESLPKREQQRLLNSIPSLKAVVGEEANARTQKAFQTWQREQEKKARRAQLETVASGEDLDESMKFGRETARKELEAEVREAIATEIRNDPEWHASAVSQMLLRSMEGIDEHPVWSALPKEVRDEAWVQQEVPKVYGHMLDHLFKTGQLFRKADVEKLRAADYARGRDEARGEMAGPDIGGTAPAAYSNGELTVDRWLAMSGREQREMGEKNPDAVNAMTRRLAGLSA